MHNAYGITNREELYGKIKKRSLGQTLYLSENDHVSHAPQTPVRDYTTQSKVSMAENSHFLHPSQIQTPGPNEHYNIPQSGNCTAYLYQNKASSLFTPPHSADGMLYNSYQNQTPLSHQSTEIEPTHGQLQQFTEGISYNLYQNQTPFLHQSTEIESPHGQSQHSTEGIPHNSYQNQTPFSHRSTEIEPTNYNAFLLGNYKNIK